MIPCCSGGLNDFNFFGDSSGRLLEGQVDDRLLGSGPESERRKIFENVLEAAATTAVAKTSRKFAENLTEKFFRINVGLKKRHNNLRKKSSQLLITDNQI
jgi:hypothetical protein